MKGLQEYRDFVSDVCFASECEAKLINTKIRKKEFIRAKYLIIAFRILVKNDTREKAASVFGLSRSDTYHALKTIKTDYETSSSYREMFSEVFEKYPNLIQ